MTRSAGFATVTLSKSGNLLEKPIPYNIQNWVEGLAFTFL